MLNRRSLIQSGLAALAACFMPWKKKPATEYPDCKVDEPRYVYMRSSTASRTDCVLMLHKVTIINQGTWKWRHEWGDDYGTESS